MTQIASRGPLGVAIASTTIGFGTAVALNRGIPEFILESNYANATLLAAFIGLVTLLLVLIFKIFPRPSLAGVVALLGGLWAVFRLNPGGPLEFWSGPFLAMAAAILATIVSFFVPVRSRGLFLWVPATSYLSAILVLTLLAGPLPSGELGQYTGSIAFGHLMVIGFLMAYFLGQTLRDYRNLFFAAGSVFLFGMMLSGSRGAIVGLFAAVLMVLARVLVRDGPLNAFREGKRFLLLGLFLTVPFFLMGTPTAVAQNIFETFNLSEQVGPIEVPVYSSGRFEIWMVTIRQFYSVPDVLFGVGESTVVISREVFHPHNLFLELLLIGGLATAVPFVVFLFRLFDKAFAQDFEIGFHYLVLAIATGTFSMFSGDLNYNIVFFLFLGLAYGQGLRLSGRTIGLTWMRKVNHS